MVTLDDLKQALREQTLDISPSALQQPLTDTQYSNGFEILTRGSSPSVYDDFIIPQLIQQTSSLFNSRTSISVLEIGPGPQSIVGGLPLGMRQKVKRYTSFEPNKLFAAKLCSWLSDSDNQPLPNLKSTDDVHCIPFDLSNITVDGARIIDVDKDSDKYDLVLFCHSLYGMSPKRKFVEMALQLLGSVGGEMVVVFHRDVALDFEGLVCHQTLSHASGTCKVLDNDDVLNEFASYLAGFTVPELDRDQTILPKWREMCRRSATTRVGEPGYLFFGAPQWMAIFDHHATSLPELTERVLLSTYDMQIKNYLSRLHQPAAVVRPHSIEEIQSCVQWALKHKTGLSVVSGSHSGHCFWPNVVAVDLSAFDRLRIWADFNGQFDALLGPLIIAGAGCKTGDIVREAMESGVTVPLGSRPSVGTGLWLQGGIGHLARAHGLACDFIVGAVIVSVNSGEVLLVGIVPYECRPPNAVRPDNEAELLWAIKGAGTNYGIVVSVVFKTCTARPSLSGAGSCH
jgi:hypothetical protein